MAQQTQQIVEQIMTKELVCSLEPLVTKVDEIGGLQLYCFNTCTNTDSSHVQQCRGLVFRGDDLIMKSFPYAMEFISDEPQTIHAFFNEHKAGPTSNILDGWRFFDSHEGTVVRLFFDEDKWYLSTHKRLDAFKSRWASKRSFGEYFIDALEAHFKETSPLRGKALLESFQESLDKDKRYIFLLYNLEQERVVCFPSGDPKLLHIGTYGGDLDLDVDCGIPKPVEHTFGDVDDLISFVSSVDMDHVQGLMCFNTIGNNVVAKVVNANYKFFYDVRGNQPSVKFRYIEVRNDSEMRTHLYNLYPEWRATFDLYENILYDRMKAIKSAYTQRYIKKENIVMPTEEFSIMKEIHGWHRQNRAQNLISFEKVREVVNAQNHPKLNRMIRNAITEQNKNRVQIKV